jgi:hypothetical protein
MDTPAFDFTPEEIADIKASLGVTDIDESESSVPEEFSTSERPVRPQRGRPRRAKSSTGRPVTADEPAPAITVPLRPAPLTKREEREVAKRLQDMLVGGTGMAGMVKPYLPMTEEEAEAIAVPLASYLVRNEPTSGVAREILENYDLLAMTLGVGAYTVRVYRDRKSELSERKPANTTAIQTVSELQARRDGREPDEGDGGQVGIADYARGGRNPFDI